MLLKVGTLLVGATFQCLHAPRWPTDSPFFGKISKYSLHCATCQSPLWLPQTRQIAPPSWSIKMIETMSKDDDGGDYDDALRAEEERWPGWELFLSQIQWILQRGGFLGPVLSLQFVPRGHTAPKRFYVFLLRLFRDGNMNPNFWIRFGWGWCFWTIL